MARQQALNPELRELRRNTQTGLSFQKVKIGATFLFVDVSIVPARPFVPLSYRRRIFNVIHGLGHPGREDEAGHYRQVRLAKYQARCL